VPPRWAWRLVIGTTGFNDAQKAEMAEPLVTSLS
jgi:dihydrodipicolinate reductase